MQMEHTYVFFLGFPPPEAAEVRSADRHLLLGEPTLFALALMGAAIVTNMVLKPHAEACSFGLSYSIVAKALLCWEIVATPDVAVTSPFTAHRCVQARCHGSIATGAVQGP